MTALHEYEDWLSTLDARLSIRGGFLTSTLGKGFIVPLDQLMSEHMVLKAAGTFLSSLQETDESMPYPLPKSYLFRRFHRLAVGHRHEASIEGFTQEFLRQHPEVSPEQVLPWRPSAPIEPPRSTLRWLKRKIPWHWFGRSDRR